MRESEEYAVESDTSSIEEASNTDTITKFVYFIIQIESWKVFIHTI